MKNSAEILIDNIGHDVLLGKFGMTARNLRHVRSTGSFAAQWYLPMKKEADARGFDCPLGAFNFKSLTQKRVDPVNELQGGGAK